MKYKKRFGKPTQMGKSLERCVQCDEREYINHQRCPYCLQALCCAYAFGMRFKDCYYGFMDRRNRITGKIVTIHLPHLVHMCHERREAIKE